MKRWQLATLVACAAMVIAGLVKVATDDAAPPEEAGPGSKAPVRTSPRKSPEWHDVEAPAQAPTPVEAAHLTPPAPPPVQPVAEAQTHDAWVGLPLDATGFSLGPGIARELQQTLLAQIRLELVNCLSSLPDAPPISKLKVEMFIEADVHSYRIVDAKSLSPELDATAARCVESAFRKRVNIEVHDDIAVSVGSKYRVAFPIAAPDNRKPPKKLPGLKGTVKGN